MISSTMKAGALFAAFLGAALCGAQQIQVQVDGEALNFPDVNPQRIGTVVMVPVRTVCERMGGTVTWDEGTQSVTCNCNGQNVVLHIGDSEATVNGEMRYLDLPPTVIQERTLVPMRFFENSLGDRVTWNGDNNLVAITSSSTTSTTTPSTEPTEANGAQTVTLHQNEVIPVSLNDSLSSTTSQVGDTFTATVVDNGSGDYDTIPAGTKIEGHVAAVQPMQDGMPGILDLAFDRLDFPNGASEAINGSLVSMDSEYVMMGDDGAYEAQNSGKSYDRMVFAGYDSMNGTLVGVNDSRLLEGTTLQDSLSDIRAQLSGDEHQPTDIALTTGSEFGVRINQDDSVRI